jgi:NIMA (never in mitosis gene a)-related kinase
MIEKKITTKPKETYTALNFLGSGGFGEAYFVRSNKTLKNYVMKSINFELLTEENRKYTINEAFLLKKIDHPNIIKFKEVFEVQKPYNQFNIIMEYAEKGDLNKFLQINIEKKIFFPEQLLLDWLCQICTALKYLHYKKIIHRDIKPANIFMNNLNQIKLGDFGISKNLKTYGFASSFVGSTYYMAPEIVDGENYSFEADIWALGVTFYELMNLKKPFRANYPAIYLEIKTKEVEEINNIYSKEFKDLIYQMLNKEPNKRPKADDILRKQFIQDKIKDFVSKQTNYKNNNISNQNIKSEIGFNKRLINRKYRIINKEEKEMDKKIKYNESIKINLESNEIKNLFPQEHFEEGKNMDDSYKYDLDRQINIYNSILSGVKTDEEIEKENNILLVTNSY